MKMLKSKRGAATAVLAIILIIGGIYWIVNYAQRECHTDKDCDGENYCGYDYKCHKPTVIEKTTVNNHFDFKFAGAVIGLSIIIAALIMKYGKRDEKKESRRDDREYAGRYATMGNGGGAGNTGYISSRNIQQYQQPQQMMYPYSFPSNAQANNAQYNSPQGLPAQAGSQGVIIPQQTNQPYQQPRMNVIVPSQQSTQQMQQADPAKAKQQKTKYSKDLKSIYKRGGNYSRHSDIVSGNNPDSIVPKI